MRKIILILSIIVLTIEIMVKCIFAANNIAVSIDAPSTKANMGDKITYTGTITNNSGKALNNIIAYISLVNITPGKESPMDLEDWSANKAIKIDTIQPYSTYEAKWPMRLIDSGNYVVYITVVNKNDNIPVTSTMSHLEIKRILRLNPNNVLPVAIGEPLLIGILFIFVVLRKREKVK